MTGKNEKNFSATLQIDAASRNISFSDFKQESSLATKQVNKEETKEGAKLRIS